MDIYCELAMIERPAFKPDWHVPVLDGVSSLVAGLIDGRRSADDIVDQLSGRARPELVYYALARLEQQGCIAEADSALPADAVVEHAALAVMAVDDYLDPRLEEWNRRALDTGEPWMIAGPACIGPIFRPGRTACWKCLAVRLEQNRPALHAVAPALNTSVPMIEGAIVTTEPPGVRRHLVTRRPQCPACGQARPVDPWRVEPIVLRGGVPRDAGRGNLAPPGAPHQSHHGNCAGCGDLPQHRADSSFCGGAKREPGDCRWKGPDRN